MNFRSPLNLWLYLFQYMIPSTRTISFVFISRPGVFETRGLFRRFSSDSRLPRQVTESGVPEASQLCRKCTNSGGMHSPY